MELHELAKDVLQKIIVEKMQFSLALKQVVKKNNLERNDRTTLSAVVGCALRHYLVMERLVNDAYPELGSEGFIALLIAFANALFIKKLDQEKCNAFAQSFLKEEDAKIEDFLKPYLEGQKLVPEDIEVGSLEFLSYRYNTPLPIIKMWNKQYGHVTTSRILKANSKPAPTVLRIDDSVISDDDFLKQYPDFEKGEVDHIVLYKGEGRFKDNEILEKHLAFHFPLAVKEAIDECDFDGVKGAAIYSEYANDCLYDLILRGPNAVNIEYIAGNYSAFINTKNFINKNNIKGVNVYEATASSIITCLSKPVHTFILFPDNSRLNLLQVSPDYFLRFDMEKLDALIANQLSVLNEASAHIEDGGYILYLVDTISKKENIGVINDFLKDHPDFKFVKDKLYFPYKKFGGSFYFAVLKKEGNND